MNKSPLQLYYISFIILLAKDNNRIIIVKLMLAQMDSSSAVSILPQS